MGIFRWISGILGWVAFGPIGGLIGYIFGSLFDSGAGQIPYQEETGRRSFSAAEQRNSFLVSLLVLSSAVIRADGKVHQKELDTVRDFIRRNFGQEAVTEAMRILESLNARQVNIYEVGPQIATYMNYSQRLQLFHYLVQIAIADGEFAKSEKSVLEAIGSTIGLGNADINSVIAMFYKDASSAYTVLEISPNATDDEVRTAYRKMAMKNHPDKVATLGPDVQKAAAEKFRQVQEAYETIKKERGII
ncbi:MAG: TerB family tellurite resistance protein [Bacteroidales bacterium]|nr:TerB family tellurite resistance protein [Bacteroidales bacterium]